MIKIALIGQTNVGKSTLFNRLIGGKKAIVSPIPDTTRDLNYGLCQWRDKNFIFIDTGGMNIGRKNDEMDTEIKKQISRAIKECDLIFFVIEIRSLENGELISGFEREIGHLIKRAKKSCFLVLNKADGFEKMRLAECPDWLKFGFDEPWPISAITGAGIGDLLDATVKHFVKRTDEPSDDKIIKDLSDPLFKIAIIGRPNVGKSTLLNSILGEDKFIVSAKPHTTRGPQDTLIYYQNEPFLIIDTAGIFRKSKIKTALEQIGVEKSLEIIRRSDIILMIIDLSEKINHQDKALLDYAIENKKALIIINNKSDLEKAWQEKFSLGQWAPKISISAKYKKNTEKILPEIKKVAKNYSQRIDDKDLNDFLKQAIVDKKFEPKIWEKIKIKQIGTKPPRFILIAPKIFVKRKSINPAQLNIIKKELRQKWNFSGVPIDILLRAMEKGK